MASMGTLPNPRVGRVHVSARDDLRMDSEHSATPPEDTPAELAALWPLVLRWARGDDVQRVGMITTAPSEDLAELAQQVRPFLSDINAYLDRTGDAERAVPFGDLAQAALEAEHELRRRA